MRKLRLQAFIALSNWGAQPSSWLALFVLTLLITVVGTALRQQPTAPPQLKNLLTQIDAAANQHDVKAVMQFRREFQSWMA